MQQEGRDGQSVAGHGERSQRRLAESHLAGLIQRQRIVFQIPALLGQREAVTGGTQARPQAGAAGEGRRGEVGNLGIQRDRLEAGRSCIFSLRRGR